MHGTAINPICRKAEVTIDEDDGTKTPFRSSSGYWYMADGKYASSDPEDRRFDLVESIA